MEDIRLESMWSSGWPTVVVSDRGSSVFPPGKPERLTATQFAETPRLHLLVGEPRDPVPFARWLASGLSEGGLIHVEGSAEDGLERSDALSQLLAACGGDANSFVTAKVRAAPGARVLLLSGFGPDDRKTLRDLAWAAIRIGVPTVVHTTDIDSVGCDEFGGRPLATVVRRDGWLSLEEIAGLSTWSNANAFAAECLRATGGQPDLVGLFFRGAASCGESSDVQSVISYAEDHPPGWSRKLVDQIVRFMEIEGLAPSIKSSLTGSINRDVHALHLPLFLAGGIYYDPNKRGFRMPACIASWSRPAILRTRR